MSCPNCPCQACQAERWEAFRKLTTQVVRTGVQEPECAYERIARDYAARGEPMPSSLLLYCGCRKCSVYC